MHKCLGCGRVYEDDAPELVNGCSCGSKYFLYYKTTTHLESKSKEEIKRIEKDILDIIKNDKSIPPDKIVVFDIESIIVPEHGKYIINLEKLFKEKAIVFKVDEGKYIIDLSKLKEIARRKNS